MREIFGVTGGTGCGKTTFLKVLEEQGFLTIDCDALYHDLLRENALPFRAEHAESYRKQPPEHFSLHRELKHGTARP